MTSERGLLFVRELYEHPGLTRIHSEQRRGLGRNTQFPVSDLHRVKSGRCGQTQVRADGPGEGSRIVAAGGVQDMDSSESSVLWGAATERLELISSPPAMIRCFYSTVNETVWHRKLPPDNVHR